MDLYCSALGMEFTNSNKVQEDILKGRSFVLHRFDSAIEGLAVQILNHKYFWTSFGVKTDSWGLVLRFPMKYNWSHCFLCMLSWDNIPAIWPLVFCSFNYLSVVRTRLLNCWAFSFSCAEFLDEPKLNFKSFLCISVGYFSAPFPNLDKHAWPSVRCTVDNVKWTLWPQGSNWQGVNEWLRSGLRRNSCDTNARAPRLNVPLYKPWTIHNHAGRYVMSEFSIRKTFWLCVHSSISASISQCLWLSSQPLSHILLTLLCDAMHHSNYF